MSTAPILEKGIQTNVPEGVKLVRGTNMIEGVQVVPLRRFPDDRGTVMHMLKETDPHFIRFGEIYFSTVYEGVIKGWHKNNGKGLNYACIHGRIKNALFDDREGSSTRGHVMEIYLGPDSYHLLVIPPGVWNGFKGLSEVAIVANCATHAHTNVQMDRMDPFENSIGYDWAQKHN